MPPTLFLIRHAESVNNAQRRLDTGLPGSALSSYGLLQASKLLPKLGVKPHVILCSTATRTQQTAQSLGQAANLRYTILDGIQEAYAGELDGSVEPQVHAEFERIIVQWHAGDLEVRPPGGESGREVLDRFLPVIQQTYRNHLSGKSNATAAVISHGTAMRLAAKVLANIDGRFTAETRLGNTDFIKLVREDGNWRCDQWGAFDLLHSPWRPGSTPTRESIHG